MHGAPKEVSTSKIKERLFVVTHQKGSLTLNCLEQWFSNCGPETSGPWLRPKWSAKFTCVAVLFCVLKYNKNTAFILMQSISSISGEH